MMRSSLNLMLAMLALAGIFAGTPAAKADGTTTAAPATSVSSNYPSAKPGSFGIGLIAGEPTGLTFKYWCTDHTAVDLGAAWSFASESSFQLYGDFLFHKFDLIRIDHGQLPVYVGVGGRVKIPDHGSTLVGVRLPVGIAYEFPDVPIELFAEVAPIVDVAPATQLKCNGGIGIRYYFR